MNKSNQTMYIVFAVIVLLVGAGGFYGGISYQKAQGASTATTTNGGGFSGGTGGGGFASRFGAGGIGSVTAVSSTSITITPRSRGGATATPKTYAITSSTTITDSGSSVAVSDITVGDNVLIQANTNNPSTATAITVNPSFGGGPQGASNSSSDSSSSTSD